jgi:hypothetical protein
MLQEEFKKNLEERQQIQIFRSVLYVLVLCCNQNLHKHSVAVIYFIENALKEAQFVQFVEHL